MIKLIETEIDLSELSPEIRSLIFSYLKQKCKEQRQLCYDNLEYDKVNIYDVDKNSILNAPEPIISENLGLGK